MKRSFKKKLILRSALVIWIGLIVVSQFPSVGYANEISTQIVAPAPGIFLASSTDGSKIAAAKKGGIWTSNDFGVTWVRTHAPLYLNWTSIASNADGTKFVASCEDGIWLSLDGGSSWTKTSAPNGPWTTLAMNSTGTKIAAAGSIGVWISSDSGGSWIQQAQLGSNQWSSLAIDSTGNSLFATSFSSGDIFTTINGGTSWANHPLGSNSNINSISSVAVSGDGSKLVVAGLEGIEESSDSGFTWQYITPQLGPYDHTIVSLNSSGSRIATVGVDDNTSTGDIWVSSDGGANWTAATPAGAHLWTSLLSSADGLHMIASGSGGIWTSQDGGSTWTNETSVGSQEFL